MSKQSRIDMYLNWNNTGYYCNTPEEQALVNSVSALYAIAKSARDNNEACSRSNLDKWRKAYKGTLNALKRDTGEESNRRSRQLRKMVYEIIESKIDNTVPLPKLTPRYKTDLPLVNITEDFLKFEVDTILSKYVNDKSERSTYIDGTTWYKVWWDSLDNTHERSGNVRIDVCLADQIAPQPGISDYRQLEYIFESRTLSVTKIYDLYKRRITPTDGTNNVEVVSFYYLNDDHVVGLFMYAPASNQVICNEESWQIRKLRTCTRCGTVNPTGDHCKNCGATTFSYKNATVEILEDDLYEVYNPYEVGQTDDKEQNKLQSRLFLSAGTEIPFYEIRQLPFVPRPAISLDNSIYGMSEVSILLDMQDAINKVLTKSVDKVLKSGAVVTKPERLKLSDVDDTFKIISVRSAEEATMVNAKQIVADTTQDIVVANMIYDSGKSSSGVTESFQGQRDTTAQSGKAKQFAAMQTAGRIESLRVMKSAAFSGVYELVLKYLLAFSDEPRRFVKILPDGSKQEECWNKYMFLDKDKYGVVYYRDDLKFDSDPASTLSQSRAQMWQETQEKFIQGAFGNPQDPRTLKLFWNVMDSLQYPLARYALAGIEENEQHLPVDVEQAIMSNPELMQLVMGILKEGQDGRGGARPNSGPEGNGNTHAANVEKTNISNRARKTPEAFSSQQGDVGGQNA